MYFGTSTAGRSNDQTVETSTVATSDDQTVGTSTSGRSDDKKQLKLQFLVDQMTTVETSTADRSDDQTVETQLLADQMIKQLKLQLI